MNSNLNICSFEKLITPNKLKCILPNTTEIDSFVLESRKTIQNIIDRKDKRLLCIVGPCSIHNIEEGKNYASLLKKISESVKEKIFIVMRVYFEKPRTNIGWKGLINEPDLDGEINMNKGLKLARELLIYINNIGVPCGCEFLETTTPQYISDLISWSAIGARTCQSQIHRQMASGLSMPVGIKNPTSGNLKVLSDSIYSSMNNNCFTGINEDGNACIFITNGNKYTHCILRGDDNGPNYKIPKILDLKNKLDNYNISTNIIIDCSHGNSNKNFLNQKIVFKETLKNMSNEESIIGVMLESNINSGSQIIDSQSTIKYGVSITDSCINIKETEELLKYAFNVIKK